MTQKIGQGAVGGKMAPKCSWQLDLGFSNLGTLVLAKKEFRVQTEIQSLFRKSQRHKKRAVQEGASADWSAPRQGVISHPACLEVSLGITLPGLAAFLGPEPKHS